jgi:hypothetical protein
LGGVGRSADDFLKLRHLAEIAIGVTLRTGAFGHRDEPAIVEQGSKQALLCIEMCTWRFASVAAGPISPDQTEEIGVLNCCFRVLSG